MEADYFYHFITFYEFIYLCKYFMNFLYLHFRGIFFCLFSRERIRRIFMVEQKSHQDIGGFWRRIFFENFGLKTFSTIRLPLRNPRFLKTRKYFSVSNWLLKLHPKIIYNENDILFMCQSKHLGEEKIWKFLRNSFSQLFRKINRASQNSHKIIHFSHS